MSQDHFRGRFRAHAAAAALFALLSLASSFPLVLHLGTQVPGEGPGDNLAFVWNLWWMRTAWHLHLNPLYTSYLFHPLGVNLTQHTNTALSGVIAATVLAPLSPVAAQNVLLLVWLFLNGFVSYLLAYRLTGAIDRAPHTARWYGALLAGIAFGGAAPVLVRLHGHFNLVAAWVIPLTVLLFVRAFERRSAAAGMAAGFCLAVTAYSDHYYLLYMAVFLALWLADRWWVWRLTSRRRGPSAASRLLVALVAVDLALMIVVAATGGFGWEWSGIRVSMRATFNLRVTLWLLIGAWVLCRRPLSVHVGWRAGADPKRDIRIGCAVAVPFVVAASPLVAGMVRLFREGAYASQPYFWHSAPAGVDVASFLIGNPLHALYGSVTRHAYAALGMNTIEGVAWIGGVTLVALAWSWRRLRSVGASGPWRAAIVVFGIWALGPWLNVFGHSPAVPLPAIILRFVPIVSNARMPGRAMVMVSLAGAMLLSLVLARRASEWSRGRKALVAALLLLDVAAGPLPLYRPESGGVYWALRQQPARGAVLELPLGLRDGFGETGRFDARTLYFQTIAERPVVGGFVARLPERVKSWYRHAPVISTVLRLSDPACPPDWHPGAATPDEVYRALSAASVAYVVLDRSAASPRLLQYVSSWPLHLVTADERRELYVVEQR